MKNDLLVQIIKDHFEKLSSKNKRFSKRSFALKVGLSSGALTDLFSGKRGISKKKAQEVLTKLGYSEAEHAQILNYTPLVREKAKRSLKKVDHGSFEELLSWEHLAIVSLTKTKNFNPSPDWIADRLCLDIEIIKRALTNLETFNMIKKVGSTYVASTEHVELFDNIPSAAIKKSQLQDFEIHKNNLASKPRELLNMSSVTFSLDLNKMHLLKSAIRLFQEQVSEIAETSNATEVFKLSMYLGPLTQVEI